MAEAVFLWGMFYNSSVLEHLKESKATYSLSNNIILKDYISKQ